MSICPAVYLSSVLPSVFLFVCLSVYLVSHSVTQSVSHSLSHSVAHSIGHSLTVSQSVSQSVTSVSQLFHSFYSFTAVPCKYFDAPEYGTRACNKKTMDSNGVLYEMICVIQCKAGYAFADPLVPNSYFCRADGVWNKLMFGVQFVPVTSGQRPWPDCARKY